MCAGHGQQGPTEAAHLESRRYGDRENAIPLCAAHHREGPDALHRLGRGGFEARWAVCSLAGLAGSYDRRFEDSLQNAMPLVSVEM